MQKERLITLQNRFQFSDSQQIGKGSTATVYRGFDLHSHQQIAVKVIHTKTFKNQVQKYLFDMQLTALQLVNHSNIIRCLAVVNSQEKCYIVTQLCNGKDLAELVQHHGPLIQKDALLVVLGILKGYQQLIKLGIHHRDLKTSNVMIHNGQAKLIDFGYCQIDGYNKPAKKYNVGSPNYMAPETFQSNIYNEKAQIWSIGAILYQIITGTTLHDGRIKMPENYDKLSKFGPRFPSHISQFSRRTINQFLSFNPDKRPTCKQFIHKITQYLYNPFQSKGIVINQEHTSKQKIKVKQNNCQNHVQKIDHSGIQREFHPGNISNNNFEFILHPNSQVNDAKHQTSDVLPFKNHNLSSNTSSMPVQFSIKPKQSTCLKVSPPSFLRQGIKMIDPNQFIQRQLKFQQMSSPKKAYKKIISPLNEELSEMKRFR